jgi:hypothetical protein
MSPHLVGEHDRLDAAPAFTATFGHVRAPRLLRVRRTSRHLWSASSRGVAFTDRDEHVGPLMRRSAGLFLTFPPMRGVGVWGRPSRPLSRCQLTHPTPTYLAASSY